MSDPTSTSNEPSASTRKFRIPSAAEVQARIRDNESRPVQSNFRPKGLFASNSNSNNSDAAPPVDPDPATPQESAPTSIAPTPPVPSITTASSSSTSAQSAPSIRPSIPSTIAQPILPQPEPPYPQFPLQPQPPQPPQFPLQPQPPQPPARPPPPPTPPVIYRPRGPNNIVVNPCQRGNPVLASITKVAYEFGDIVPDYHLGQTSCALFLSLKYHRLHPEYVYARIKALGGLYLLRVLIVLVDIEDPQHPLRELTKVAIVGNLTMAMEHKPPDAIKERVDDDYLSKLTDCLTQVKSINKTDVMTLASTFGSLQNIMNASVEELSLCPGFGEQKVRRLYEAFHQPFILRGGGATASKANKSSAT
ncbi:hypothetical protein BJ742DRAFT_905697 [Cladochytrium replicatum]|nr:hypothetical protein BJ742DRAFT_905697 [Cladochytrium replicatum]